MKIEGYAAVFNAWSYIAGAFWEVVRPGAFAKSLRDDEVYLVHHHDFKTVLGTTGNGTLRLREDTRGLHFTADLPDTTAARDLVELIGRRDVRGMSFAFRPRGADGQIWRERKNGDLERELFDVQLFEVTITPTPAYRTTAVSIHRAKRTAGAATEPLVAATRARLQRRLMAAKLRRPAA